MNANRPLVASAVAYAGLFLAGSFLPTLPEGAYSDARVIGLLADSGSRTGIVLGGLLLTLAGLAVLPFLAGLALRLHRADPRSTAGVVVLGAGLVHVVMLLVAARSFSGYATGIAVGELEVPVDATMVRVLSDQGFGTLLLPGLMAAGVAMGVASLAARRHALLPGWLTVAGLVMAVLTLGGALWIPQFLPPLWVLLVALTLAEGSPDPARDGVAAPAGRRTS